MSRNSSLKKLQRSIPSTMPTTRSPISPTASSATPSDRTTPSPNGRAASRLSDSQIAALELLTRLSQGIHDGLSIADAKPRASSVAGRDAEARPRKPPRLRPSYDRCGAPSPGLAARFASGDRASMPRRGADRRRMVRPHAWAQVYLPGIGWTAISIRPAATLARPASLRWRSVRDPEQATPHGTFVGSWADTLGMEAHVSVTPHAPRRPDPAPAFEICFTRSSLMKIRIGYEIVYDFPNPRR